MRTYDFNDVVRAKYHFQFLFLEGSYDNGEYFYTCLFLTLGILLKLVEIKSKTVYRYF